MKKAWPKNKEVPADSIDSHLSHITETKKMLDVQVQVEGQNLCHIWVWGGPWWWGKFMRHQVVRVNSSTQSQGGWGGVSCSPYWKDFTSEKALFMEIVTEKKIQLSGQQCLFLGPSNRLWANSSKESGWKQKMHMWSTTQVGCPGLITGFQERGCKCEICIKRERGVTGLWIRLNKGLEIFIQKYRNTVAERNLEAQWLRQRPAATLQQAFLPQGSLWLAHLNY